MLLFCLIPLYTTLFLFCCFTPNAGVTFWCVMNHSSRAPSLKPVSQKTSLYTAQAALTIGSLVLLNILLILVTIAHIQWRKFATFLLTFETFTSDRLPQDFFSFFSPLSPTGCFFPHCFNQQSLTRFTCCLYNSKTFKTRNWSLLPSPRALRWVFALFYTFSWEFLQVPWPFLSASRRIAAFIAGRQQQKYPSHTDSRFPGGVMYKRDGISLGMERQCSQRGGWIIRAFFMPVTLASLFWASTKVSQSYETKCWVL